MDFTIITVVGLIVVRNQRMIQGRGFYFYKTLNCSKQHFSDERDILQTELQFIVQSISTHQSFSAKNYNFLWIPLASVKSFH